MKLPLTLQPHKPLFLPQIFTNIYFFFPVHSTEILPLANDLASSTNCEYKPSHVSNVFEGICVETSVIAHYDEVLFRFKINFVISSFRENIHLKYL